MAKIKGLFTRNMVILSNEAKYLESCKHRMENFENMKAAHGNKSGVDVAIEESLLDEDRINRDKSNALGSKVISLTAVKAPMTPNELEKLLPNYKEFANKKTIDLGLVNNGFDVTAMSQKYLDEQEKCNDSELFKNLAIDLIKQDDQVRLNKLMSDHDQFSRECLYTLIAACGEFDNRALAIKLLQNCGEQNFSDCIGHEIYLENFLVGQAKGGHTDSLLKCLDNQFHHQGVVHGAILLKTAINASIWYGKKDTLEGILDYVRDDFKGDLSSLLDGAMEYINSNKESLCQTIGIEKCTEINRIISNTLILKDLPSNKELREDISKDLMSYSTNHKLGMHRRRIKILQEAIDLGRANPSCMLELLINQRNKIDGSSQENYDYNEWCKKNHSNASLMAPELFEELNHIPIFKGWANIGIFMSPKTNTLDCIGVLEQCIKKIEEHNKHKSAFIQREGDHSFKL